MDRSIKAVTAKAITAKAVAEELDPKNKVRREKKLNTKKTRHKEHDTFTDGQRKPPTQQLAKVPAHIRSLQDALIFYGD